MPEGNARTRATLSIAPYRVLLYSGTVVIFGVMGQTVARGWLAQELTGSNAGLGAVMLAFGASMLLATPFGGVAADRYPKRLVLAGSVVTIMVTSFIVGSFVALGAVQFWMLMVASAIQAMAFAFYVPARIALISEMVPPPLVQNAVVLAQVSSESARVVAPALAGLMISVSWSGSGGVFLGAGALSSIAALLMLRLPRSVPNQRAPQSPIAELLDAVAYVRSHRAVGAIALVTVGVVMVGFPYLTFLPALATDRFDVGATGFGVMSGASGVGAFIAGVVATTHNRGVRPGTTIVGSAGAFSASLIAVGVANSYALVLIALVAAGASGLVFQTSTQALMLRLAPIEFHGRLQSMVVLGFSGFGLAALPLGVLADAISLRWTFVGMGAAIGVITLWFAAVRRGQRGAGVHVDYG